MSETFEITVDRDEVPVLRLKGRLDATGAQEVREVCTDIYKQGDVVLFVYLADVTFVSSSGLGTFLYLTEMFRDVGGKVVFVAPSGPVTDVISLLNLDQFLEITDSVEAAMTVVGA